MLFYWGKENGKLFETKILSKKLCGYMVFFPQLFETKILSKKL